MNAEGTICIASPIKHSVRIVSILIGLVVFLHCGRSSTLLVFSISPLSFPNLTAGAPNELLLAANGAVPPYRWSTSAGSLPRNMSLTFTGGSALISGTPDTAARAATFTIQVTDSANQSASQTYTVAVLKSSREGKNDEIRKSDVDKKSRILGCAGVLGLARGTTELNIQ